MFSKFMKKGSETRIDRRGFLETCSRAGLGLFGGALALGGAPGQALAAENHAAKRLWVCVHAAGGWDPTALCDPKGAQSETDESPVNHYLASNIGKAGNLRYAPIEGAQAFFERHRKRLLVVNGIDTATNGHDSGVRNVWSGKLVEGYPAFAALLAAEEAERPMAFITNGGYDTTAGLVAPTRVGNTDIVARLAYPNRSDPNNVDSQFHSTSAEARIAAFRAERLGRLREAATLPKMQRSLDQLALARQGRGDIGRLTASLPAELDNSGNPLRRQAQLAMAAFESGLAVSANLVIGGFDTHGNHDADHHPRLGALLDGVDLLWTIAEEKGLADRLTIVIGSDFGRTPWYNDGNGKDHWSITSMMFMGRGIPGDRVIGATDAGHSPLTVDPKTLAIDPKGVRITPEHVHVALRTLAGITDAASSASFGLSAASLPLFAGA